MFTDCHLPVWLPSHCPTPREVRTEGWTEGRNASDIAQNVGLSSLMGPWENSKGTKERFPLLRVPIWEERGSLVVPGWQVAVSPQTQPSMEDSPSKRAHRRHLYLPESQVPGGHGVGHRKILTTWGVSWLAAGGSQPPSLGGLPAPLLLLGQHLGEKRGRGQTSG